MKKTRVLVTGGIGAGKSTICKMFEELEVPVFYSDDSAKKIGENNPFVHRKFRKKFGDEIFDGHKLNRKKLAQIVFNDEEKLEQLNNIIHPLVKEDFNGFCWEYEHYSFKYPDVHYVIEEAAIGIELGIQDDFDYVVLVTADNDTKIKRVMERDNCTEDQVLDRMKNQFSDAKKTKFADFIIENNDFPNAKCQVQKIHEDILGKVKNKT